MSLSVGDGVGAGSSASKSYRDTVLGSWRDNALFSMLVELTYRCNLDCVFCYNDLGLTGKPLGFSEYERLLEDARELGCLHLILSGGEPLMHPDFFRIGGRARELGFVVRVKSNGHSFFGERIARLVQEVDPFVVELSLHGARAETHDRQTRVPGSFSRLLRNLAEMKSHGIRLKLNATLTRWNENEVEGMFRIADDLAIALSVDPEVTPKDDGDKTPLALAPSAEGLKRLFEVLGERRRARGGDRLEIQRESEPVVSGSGSSSGATSRVHSDKHCGAGSAAVAVDPYGNVYPCVAWRRRVGNLHNRRLVEIWRGNERLEKVRRITGAAKDVTARLGDAQSYLSFCPGAAETRSGNPLEIPSDTEERARLYASLAAEERSEVPLPLHPGE